MIIIERTGIWRRTLAEQGERDPSAKERGTLRHAFIQFRERADTLAQEIARDIPTLTVHDVTHLDALWEVADQIVGPDYELTPPEVFVLGSSFLVHDLGHSLAAYAEGLSELKTDPLWRDCVARLLIRELGNPPSPEQIDSPGPTIEQEAKEQILRQAHARRAQDLAELGFKHRKRDSEYFLLENVDLRNIYGRLIGRIAYSHWWPTSKLTEEFGTYIGAPTFCPNGWTVDPLKLACLLRVADACHLDARRAPGFLRALRKPSGVAEEHWRFQEYIQKPQVINERLVFSAPRPFPVEDAEAWWLCYDTLSMADRELREVDSLLRDSSRPTFEVVGITGIDDPKRLLKHIPTDGWQPIDTKIKVTDVANLVQKLGGEQLYGKDPTIPLRELIQNSADAVRARRLLEGREAQWGEITVTLMRDDDGEWIEVRDSGLGMSEALLTGPFLDFAATYWGSDLMSQEYPGLLAKGFEPTGKYGIGFFSAFIWGKKVQVITRRPSDSVGDTKVLTFENGVHSRPILRFANATDARIDAGTTVRVQLETPANEPGGLLGDEMISDGFGSFGRRQWRSKDRWSLKTLCEWLCPAIDVNLFVDEEEKGRQQVARASDWLDLSGIELLWRVLPHLTEDIDTKGFVELLEGNIRELQSPTGDVVGRACIPVQATDYSRHQGFRDGLITVGGLRTSKWPGILGVSTGVSETIARNVATPFFDQEELARWASQQADILPSVSQDAEALSEAAHIIRAYGGQTKSLPIALTRDGWLNFDEIALLLGLPDEILLVHDSAWHGDSRQRQSLSLLDNVFVTAMGRLVPEFWAFRGDFQNRARHDFWDFHWATLCGATAEALSRAWGVSLQELLDASVFSTDQQTFSAIYAQDEIGQVVYDGVDILRKPS